MIYNKNLNAALILCSRTNLFELKYNFTAVVDVKKYGDNFSIPYLGCILRLSKLYTDSFFESDVYDISVRLCNDDKFFELTSFTWDLKEQIVSNADNFTMVYYQKFFEFTNIFVEDIAVPHYIKILVKAHGTDEWLVQNISVIDLVEWGI